MTPRVMLREVAGRTILPSAIIGGTISFTILMLLFTGVANPEPWYPQVLKIYDWQWQSALLFDGLAIILYYTMEWTK